MIFITEADVFFINEAQKSCKLLKSKDLFPKPSEKTTVVMKVAEETTVALKTIRKIAVHFKPIEAAPVGLKLTTPSTRTNHM